MRPQPARLADPAPNRALGITRWAPLIAMGLVIGVCSMQHSPGQVMTPAQATQPTSRTSGDAQSPAANTSSQPQEQKLNAELSAIMPLIRERHTGPARVRIRNYLNLHPDDGQAHFLFGLTYHREKKYGEAKPWFESALALAPGFAITHYFFGWTLYWLGDLERARSEFETYLLSNPTEHDSHFALGLICLDEDDLECAERLFKRSIAYLQLTDANDKAALSRAQARLGEVHDRRGELPEARALLEEAITIYPDHYEAVYKLYRVLVRQGETERAAAVHRQYLETRERVRPGTSFPE